jgi:hypothetical protein
MKPLVDSKDYTKSRIKNLKILMNISKYPEIYRKERNLLAKQVVKDEMVLEIKFRSIFKILVRKRWPKILKMPKFDLTIYNIIVYMSFFLCVWV